MDLPLLHMVGAAKQHHAVFGVPGSCIKGQQFWGADSMSLMQDYMASSALFDQSEMRGASKLPVEAQRRTGL